MPCSPTVHTTTTPSMPRGPSRQWPPRGEGQGSEPTTLWGEGRGSLAARGPFWGRGGGSLAALPPFWGRSLGHFGGSLGPFLGGGPFPYLGGSLGHFGWVGVPHRRCPFLGQSLAPPAPFLGRVRCRPGAILGGGGLSPPPPAAFWGEGSLTAITPVLGGGPSLPSGPAAIVGGGADLKGGRGGLSRLPPPALSPSAAILGMGGRSLPAPPPAQSPMGGLRQSGPLPHGPGGSRGCMGG